MGSCAGWTLRCGKHDVLPWLPSGLLSAPGGYEAVVPLLDACAHLHPRLLQHLPTCIILFHIIDMTAGFLWMPKFYAMVYEM